MSRYVIQYPNGNYASEFGNRHKGVDGRSLEHARVFANIANARCSAQWRDSAKVVEVAIVVPEKVGAVVLFQLDVELANANDLYDRVAQATGMTREEAKAVVLGASYGQDSIITSKIDSIDVALSLGGTLHDVVDLDRDAAARQADDNPDAPAIDADLDSPGETFA